MKCSSCNSIVPLGELVEHHLKPGLWFCELCHELWFAPLPGWELGTTMKPSVAMMAVTARWIKDEILKELRADKAADEAFDAEMNR